MSTRKKEGSRAAPLPQVSPDDGIGLLEAQIRSGEQILGQRPISSDAHASWKLVTLNYLEKAFGGDSPNVTSVMDVGVYGAFPMNAGEAYWENHRFETLRTQIAKLRSLLE